MGDFNVGDALADAISRLKNDLCVGELIALYDAGHITRLEVFDNVWQHCAADANMLETIVERMAKHHEQWVRETAADIQSSITRRENRVTDISEIMKSSPLQPGIRIRLDGGYEPHDPWWLNGNEYYSATFVRFASRGADEMPVAFVEFDQEIRMIEGSGLQHHGRYALLKLLHVASWDATETVTVHVVEQFPDDVAAYYESRPFGSEIESHATYRLERTNGT
jgi:hypothetical protein